MVIAQRHALVVRTNRLLDNAGFPGVMLMPTFDRLAAPLLLATYLLLSLVPFFGWMVGVPVAHPAATAAWELLMWAALWTVCQRPAWFHWALLPAFLALPVELYLRIFFGQGISTHHLGILVETSPAEAIEFLGKKVWWLVLLAFLLIFWWSLTAWLALRRPVLVWRGRTRWAALILVIGIGVAVVGTTLRNPSTEAAHTASAASVHAWWPIRVERATLADTWPFGIALHGMDFYKERKYLAELSGASRSFLFGARQLTARPPAQVVVMVIGESARYDRWGINGYARDTTPLLKGERNLVTLSNVVSAVSATRLSVPILVSRKPATESLQAQFREKSFITAYREAGFKTYWLSNQMSFGEYDTPISVYANEADVALFLNLGGMSKESDLDAVLLDPLSNALADPAPKKLIVLHTLGSHWNYSHRYPQSFDKWQPSLFGVDKPAYTDLAIKPQLNNSYDNSILYTDWLLDQVVTQLKSVSGVSSMVYVADHGQTLYDGSCHLAFHGHNTQYEFHVPALVWYSDAYRAAYPDKVARLLRNRRAKLATENVFHSLLDMADIRYATEHLEYSFLNRAFRPHKRYVDSYGWTDYDNATFKGDCREVIDNGTPLPQTK